MAIQHLLTPETALFGIALAIFLFAPGKAKSVAVIPTALAFFILSDWEYGQDVRGPYKPGPDEPQIIPF